MVLDKLEVQVTRGLMAGFTKGIISVASSDYKLEQNYSSSTFYFFL